MTVLLGNGDGSLQASLSYVAGKYAKALVAFDFNGDGFPDLATNTDDGLSILFNGADSAQRRIGDGPRPFAPLNISTPSESISPTVAQKQISAESVNQSALADDTALSPRPKRTVRHLARVAYAEPIDPVFDLISTESN